MPSVFSALYAGVNGINSNGEAVNILGDNISNVNTNGYKSNRPEFSDIVAGISSEAGLGSRMQEVTTLFSQGGFESTSVPTDMAIDGRGFFAVRETSSSSVYYTRNGQFNIDKDGFLVNASGQSLQGYAFDASTQTLSSTVGDLQLSYEPVAPRATEEINVQANLDSNEAIPDDFDVSDPVATSNFAAGITVYDSLGNDHLVTIYYRKDAANSWEWYGVVDGAELTSGVTAICAEGTVTFDSQGRQTAFDQTTSDFDFIGATQNQEIDFNFGSTIADGNGLDGITQFGSVSSLNALGQDGYKSGNLTTIEIDDEGFIIGNYSNGTISTLGQVALVLFANEQGLRRDGGNVYRATLGAGEALFGGPKAGGRGTVLSQTLEQSNVDLASELIKMVVIQRGFQANSRTVSVVNELLGNLVSLGS